MTLCVALDATTKPSRWLIDACSFHIDNGVTCWACGGKGWRWAAHRKAVCWHCKDTRTTPPADWVNVPPEMRRKEPHPDW
jgi:hypothetical protein